MYYTHKITRYIPLPSESSSVKTRSLLKVLIFFVYYEKSYQLLNCCSAIQSQSQYCLMMFKNIQITSHFTQIPLETLSTFVTSSVVQGLAWSQACHKPKCSGGHCYNSSSSSSPSPCVLLPLSSFHCTILLTCVFLMSPSCCCTTSFYLTSSIFLSHAFLTFTLFYPVYIQVDYGLVP